MALQNFNARRDPANVVESFGVRERDEGSNHKPSGAVATRRSTSRSLSTPWDRAPNRPLSGYCEVA
jgi:hypothetical protein